MSVPIHRLMLPRDPHQEHRTATPLELFFDLTMVVAVSASAAGLHHEVSAGHAAHGLGTYLMCFFGVWWAWVNFTWFSSAYDTDDLLMRLMTMVQMAGVLVLAAGVPRAFERSDFSVIVLGYVVMRVALLLQWMRAGHESGDPDGTCRRYWTAILAVQVYWVAQLWAPAGWHTVTLLVGVVCELLVPVYAETRGRRSPWHAEHIAERYGLFVIIVCGEVVLSASDSFSTAVEEGLTLDLLLTGVGAVLVVFTVWSMYFHRDHSDDLVDRGPWGWAYLHYGVFASVAAVGAGIGVMVDLATEQARLPLIGADLLLAGSVTGFLVFTAVSSYLLNRHLNELFISLAIAWLVLAVGVLGRSPGLTTALIGTVLLGSLLANAVVARRLYGDGGRAAEHVTR